MKKFFVPALLLCFISCLIPVVSSAEEGMKMDNGQCMTSEGEETGETEAEEKGEELDLGEPTEEEMSEMDRESEWRDEEENDYPAFEGDREGSTQQMQDF